MNLPAFEFPKPLGMAAYAAVQPGPQGSRFTFSVQCGGLVPMQGEGEVSFSATSFEGSLAIKAEVTEMGPVQTKSRVTGSRLGDCQKNPQ